MKAHTQWRALPALVVSGCVLALSVRADWDVEDPAKWLQMPDETIEGLDVRAWEPKLLADDFLCTNQTLITNLHVWGSWLNDEVPPQTNVCFTIAFWSDISTNEPGVEYSRPGTKLWETNVCPRDYVHRLWLQTAEGEGWYDPNTGVYLPPPADRQIWQLNFSFAEEGAFEQMGTEDAPVVYWVSLQAVILEGEPGQYQFGWKSSPDHWNDDAVWADSGLMPAWNELRYPPGHPREGESIDLAFVLEGEGPQQTGTDFGDANDPPYPTRLANTGASHTIGGPWLGDAQGQPDAETDGQPTVSADGDDLDAGGDDEQGVRAPVLFAGQTNQLEIVVGGAPGTVDGWIDMDGSGTWAAGERVVGQVLGTGTNHVRFLLPMSAAGQVLVGRFRIHTGGSLGPTGPAPDGEVEDYLFMNGEPNDWGDAPDSLTTPGYPTLAVHTGAVHSIVSGVHLGRWVDAELNGQPDGTSTGDDDAPGYLPDDEDGVVLPPVMVIGRTYTVPVVASAPGFLSVWMDFAADGDWDDATETVVTGLPVTTGTNLVAIAVPPTARAGGPHARFRYSVSAPVSMPTGSAPDGEVEDYEMNLQHADFGDAPDRYDTLFASGGARHWTHTNAALRLGQRVDVEPDGVPGVSATGDDSSQVDDEDGIRFEGPLVRGAVTGVQVIASAAGVLDGWIDFNRDGDWADGGEQVFAALPVAAGTNALAVTVPATAGVGPSYARFRLSSATNLTWRGAAPDGEVEDYRVTLYQPDPGGGPLVITNIWMSPTQPVGKVWWSAQTNVTYEVQRITNLLSGGTGGWTGWAGTVTGPANSQTDTNATRDERFYRVVVPYVP